MEIKEHFGCKQTQIFSMYGFSTPTKAFQDPSTFLPGVVELKLAVIIPIILQQFPFPCIFHLTDAGWLCWCLIALRHILSHFGRGQFT